MLDIVRRVETPEGVELQLRAAGPLPRLYAAVLDGLLRFFGCLAVAVALSALGRLGAGLVLLVFFAAEWIYPVAFEVLARGATPGKRALGLAVVHDDGTPVAFAASAVRNLVRFADFLPLAYAFGVVTMLVARDFRRLGDLAAGTLVVHVDRASPGARVPPVPPQAPPVALLSHEQRAIVEFAERAGRWPEARARELANVARPLTSATGQRSVDRLLGIASWLVGRR